MLNYIYMPKKTKLLSGRVPEALYNDVQARLKKGYGISQSEFVRRACILFLESEKDK